MPLGTLISLFKDENWFEINYWKFSYHLKGFPPIKIDKKCSAKVCKTKIRKTLLNSICPQFSYFFKIELMIWHHLERVQTFFGALFLISQEHELCHCVRWFVFPVFRSCINGCLLEKVQTSRWASFVISR